MPRLSIMNCLYINKRFVLFGCLSIALLIVSSLALTSAQTTASVMLLEVDGPIGPATTEYLARSFTAAAQEDKQLVVIRLDTPGGLTASTRDIVKTIRSATIPVATWVAPEGARAASAGTYILYASHIAAMAPATNLGAATPIAIGPPSPSSPAQEPDPDEQTDSDESNANKPADKQLIPAPATASERKALNDAAAWIRGLAQATGRNAEWAEQAVREAVSLTASEALAINVIDLVAANLDELLQQIDGRELTVNGELFTMATAGLAAERRAPGWRSRILAVITNPTLAYILLMVGIYGLLLEGYNPGSLVPGTIGAIALLTALYAFQILPVNYAGLLLIVLGAALMAAEAFVPSFGILGIGGIVSVVVGSVILMDTDAPGFEIAIEVISAVSLGFGLIMAMLIALAIKAWRRPVVSGSAEILHAHGEALTDIDELQGEVWVMSERWQARSRQPIKANTPIRVTQREGLTLQVTADTTVEALESTPRENPS